MRTRFAPSPTGPLHLGHAYSAMLAHDMARAAQGTFLLRIEDIDQGRARPEWEALIYEDLAWLGLDWERPVMRQSDRMDAYETALDRLWGMGLLYPCGCNRRDIRAAASAPNEGDPLSGPDGIVYPGTCRPERPPDGKRPESTSLRLDIARALDWLKKRQSEVTETGESTSTFPTFKALGDAAQRKGNLVNAGENAEDERNVKDGPAPLTYEALNVPLTALTLREVKTSPDTLTNNIGDVVLARKDMGTSYHLSVVVDDAAQDISHVIRGADLFDATPIHVLLQMLLDLPTPIYLHHRLIRDEDGKRLAKRDDARAIRLYREAGETPEDIRRRVGLSTRAA